MLRLFFLLTKQFVVLLGHLRGFARQAAVSLGGAGLTKPADPGRLWRSFVIILPIAYFVAWAMPQLTLVMSPSIEARIVRKAPGPIRRNDYVMFTLRHPIAGPEPILVTKKALCLPGDRLRVIERPSTHAVHALDGHYYCNGLLLGISLPLAHNGMKLTHLLWSGIIPPGMIYVGSHHPRGFDSRYFGLLPVARLTRMEQLL